MSLVLHIDTDENYDFFVLYDLLSALRKLIWNKLAKLTREWTNVMPSQSKLALWCGCSRSAVSEALQLFKSYGWIHLESRGWKRPKKILISHSKQQVDVKNRNYFKNVRTTTSSSAKATHKATHTLYTEKKKTSKKEPCLIAIRHFLKKKEIPLEVQLKLSMVSEYAYQETLFQCDKRAKKGFKPDDEFRYFAQVAIKIAIKNGEKLDWPSYFYTLDILRKESYAA